MHHRCGYFCCCIQETCSCFEGYPCFDPFFMFGILSFNHRGDKAFCSMECRENFMEDEMEEGEPDLSAPPSSPVANDGCIFQLIQWTSISKQLDMVLSEVLSEVNKLQPWMWSYFIELLPEDFVCRGTDEFTYWFLNFTYPDPRIFGGAWTVTLLPVILLFWSERACVWVWICVCLNLIFNPLSCWHHWSLSCIWIYVLLLFLAERKC